MRSKGKIVIVSTILDDWGGSEELWSKAVPTLQAHGFGIVFIREHINLEHPAYIALADQGVVLDDLSIMPIPPPKPPLNERIVNRLNNLTTKKPQTEEIPDPVFVTRLKAHQPDMVIISQGINFDGLNYAYLCGTIHIPYATITQKAVDFFWPRSEDRAAMASLLAGAKRNYFVSNHNRHLTEEQLGLRLINAEIVYNPVKNNGVSTYPSTQKGYRLACMGRLFIIDKGQDILLRIMAKPKWKNRPLKISFIGTGPDMEGLADMARLLQVDNIEFKGYVQKDEDIWVDHHALILPSRSEGMPLVLLEAMAAGRTAIVSDAGGNAEVIQEGQTGFIGQANEIAFEEAMERAWDNRDQWEEMGMMASAFITANVPASPEIYFAERVIKMFYE